MPRVTANGLELEYETFGDPTDPPLVLIMGLSAQMTNWPEGFCNLLAEQGYHVIRFDNRDVGLSTYFDDLPRVDLPAVLGGDFATAPYRLSDFANDTVGLLDALGIAKAHIVGASMGGMIAQLIAAHHPERTLSLTSIMSSTGNPALPPAKPEAMAVLLNRPPLDDFEAFVAHGVRNSRVIGSPGYPAAEAELRAQIVADFKRCYCPDGFSRQAAAVIANGDRRAVLKRIAAPTVVVHGADDPLVPLDAGKDTAANIAGAELRILPGMGHDLPPALFSAVVEAIEAAAARARVAA